MSEFTKGEFKHRDPRARAPSVERRQRVKRVDRVLGQGLLRPGARSASIARTTDVAIIRVEQLYPFPHKAFQAEMKKYPHLRPRVVWCQDEPQNQGAWFFVQHYIHENMTRRPEVSATPAVAASASPAVGYAHLHQEQQIALLEQAFARSSRAFILTK